MANLSELPQWDAGVYRLETTDQAEGGESGKANAPLKNLANRTAYLKSHVDALESASSDGSIVPDASTTVKGKVELATNAETITGTDTVRAVTPAGVAAAIAAISAGGLGYSQVWTDVSASRVAGTTYQNNTSNPIVVDVEASGSYGSTTNVTLSVFVSNNGGSTWEEFATNMVAGVTSKWSRSVVVPPGKHYKFSHSGSAFKVRELR